MMSEVAKICHFILYRQDVTYCLNMIKSDINIIQSDSNIIQSDKNIIQSDRKIIQSDRNIKQSDKNIIKSDRNIIQSDRIIIQSDRNTYFTPIIQSDVRSDYLTFYKKNKIFCRQNSNFC